VVDGKWSVVGSANMDIRSKELNQENVLGILDEGFRAAARGDVSRRPQEGRGDPPADWRRRGVGARLKERAAVLFAEQY
jgi:cardiolipin synthase